MWHTYFIGTANEFRRKYELPILGSRDADATDSAQQKGKEKLEELLQLVNKCIIRRTQVLLTKYLPVKSEYQYYSSSPTIYPHAMLDPGPPHHHASCPTLLLDVWLFISTH